MCSSEAQARIASNVFKYLSESSDWWEIESKFCEKCSTHYLTGKRRKDDAEAMLLLPISINLVLDFEAIESIFSCLPSVPKVTLALQDGDTNIVFYDVALGVVNPSRQVKTTGDDELPTEN